MRNSIILLAMLALNLNLFAEVQHTVHNFTLDAGNGTTLTIEGTTINLSFWSFAASGFQLDGNETHVGLVSGPNSGDFKILSLGDEIGPSGDFMDPAPYSPAYHGDMTTPAGDVIQDGESMFFGFKVIDGNDSYYAWMKITRVSNEQLIIDEYAYEDQVNIPINAGDTVGETASIMQSNSSKLQIQLVDNTLLFSNTGGEIKIMIFDLSGKLLVETSNMNSVSTNSFNSGYHVVKVLNHGGHFETQKIYIP